jgi:membrane associated rhomboid family serine protease
MSTRAKAGAGVVIAILYGIGMSARGHVAAGVVGGLLAGVVCFLALREYERQRSARSRDD